MGKKYRLEFEDKGNGAGAGICYLAWTTEAAVMCAFLSKPCAGLLMERPEMCPLVEVTEEVDEARTL